MKQERTEQAIAVMPAEGGGRPSLAALWLVLLALVALVLPVLASPARAEPGLVRRSSDSRFDQGLTRLQTLILPSPDHLRKAQSLKVQPKVWIPAVGDGALATSIAAGLLPSATGASPAIAAGRNLFARPYRAHGPRAPPVTLSPL